MGKKEKIFEKDKKELNNILADKKLIESRRQQLLYEKIKQQQIKRLLKAQETKKIKSNLIQRQRFLSSPSAQQFLNLQQAQQTQQTQRGNMRGGRIVVGNPRIVRVEYPEDRDLLPTEKLFKDDPLTDEVLFNEKFVDEDDLGGGRG